MLLSLFEGLQDFRRSQGRTYQLKHILLFSVLAMLSGADSYRNIATFIEEHFQTLKQTFGLKWIKPPAYTSVRNILIGVDIAALELIFREHAKQLTRGHLAGQAICLDGKTLNGSYDYIKGKHALQVLTAFLSQSLLILAHEEINSPDKNHEIQAVSKLLRELKLAHNLLTLDALHCQKKL